ncbi:SIMPL domain-containing protein, partial [Vibrio astriarenae]
VTVRGVAEKQVTADLAIWPLKVRVAGNDLATASQSADAARDKVLAFLQDNGINAKDIVGRDVHVVDRQATDYAQANAQLRY